MRVPVLVTAPTVEPLSLEEVKAWAKIDTDDDDALLNACITAARQMAEDYTRRAFITQTWRLDIDLEGNSLYRDLPEGYYDLPVTALYGSLPKAIELPRAPVQSITSVKTYNTSNTESTYSSDNYSLLGTRLVLDYDAIWPTALRPVRACSITYVAGYGASASSVPQAIRTAILMHIQHMYDNRTICDMPASCQAMLKNYRIMDGLR